MFLFVAAASAAADDADGADDDGDGRCDHDDLTVGLRRLPTLSMAPVSHCRLRIIVSYSLAKIIIGGVLLVLFFVSLQRTHRVCVFAYLPLGSH